MHAAGRSRAVTAGQTGAPLTNASGREEGEAGFQP